jgi:hypothetical protein
VRTWLRQNRAECSLGCGSGAPSAQKSCPGGGLRLVEDDRREMSATSATTWHGVNTSGLAMEASNQVRTRHAVTATRCALGERWGYLSTSPTTKNIDPRMDTMSATSWPGSISPKTCTLLKDAERSLRRYGVFSPRDTKK